MKASGFQAENKELLRLAEAHLMILEVCAPDLTDPDAIAYWASRIDFWRTQTAELAREVI